MDSLTVREVAERLDISVGAVRRMLSGGRLEGFKSGRQWRIPEAALPALSNGPGADPVTLGQILELVKAERCPVCASLLRKTASARSAGAVPSWGWYEGSLECSFCDFTLAENASCDPDNLKRNVDRYLERLNRQISEGRKACAVLTQRSKNLQPQP